MPQGAGHCVMGHRVCEAPAEAEPIGCGHCKAGRKPPPEEADGEGGRARSGEPGRMPVRL